MYSNTDTLNFCGNQTKLNEQNGEQDLKEKASLFLVVKVKEIVKKKKLLQWN
jgi:hypothetical protein